MLFNEKQVKAETWLQKNMFKHTNIQKKQKFKAKKL